MVANQPTHIQVIAISENINPAARMLTLFGAPEPGVILEYPFVSVADMELILESTPPAHSHDVISIDRSHLQLVYLLLQIWH